MTKQMLVDAVGMIDSTYIEEFLQTNVHCAAKRAVRKKRSLVVSLISAACLVLVMTVLLASLPLYFFISPSGFSQSVHKHLMPENIEDSTVGDWTQWQATDKVFALLRMGEEDSVAAKLQQADRGLISESLISAGCLLDELYQYYLEHRQEELPEIEQGKQEPDYPIPIPGVSEGLTFEKTSAGNYRVTGFRPNADGIVCIPAEHEGVRVVEIKRDLFKYNTWIKELYVLGGVSTIQANSFQGCESLELVYLGESVTKIQQYAFFECKNLKEVYVSDSLAEIELRAFEECVSLQSISLPEATQIIGSRAFYGCVSLQTAELPASMKSLGDSVFYGCSALEQIEMPAGITELSNNMFLDCSSLESVIIPDGYLKIGDLAFLNCVSLKTVVMPDSITLIGERAFSNCGMSEIKLSASLVEIKRMAFYDCKKLQKVTIGSALTKIGDYAFQNTGVSEYFYDGTQAGWKKISKGTKWFGHSYTVHCTDGDI